MKQRMIQGTGKIGKIRLKKNRDNRGISFLKDKVMNKAFLKEIKELLLEQKHEILRNLAAENEEFRELIEDKDPKDLVDIASEDIDKKMLKTLEAQEVKRLQLIEAAIVRIQNDHYGKCLKCGMKIPEERLKAIPYATLCINCKSKDERRRR
jgi:DnaK suppressor protein